MKKTMDRRQFLKYSAAGLAGIGLSTLNVPFFRMGKANAALSGDAWCFGVMSDTQWEGRSGGKMTCATGIIDVLNQQFIDHGCKFVIQVGDLCNDERVWGIRTMPTRANHTQALYDAGIGFFPCRGNHESSASAARKFPELFPQTRGYDNLFGAENIQAAYNEELHGLSYTFDYNNVRCIMIDQFTRKDGSNFNSKHEDDHNNNAVDQVPWVDDMLSSAPQGFHSFVFSHKNLIGQSHKDNLFGGNVTSNTTARDAFITSLYRHGTGYYMGGHDHMHHRSLVSTSDGAYKVPQIITASNSYKFYTPKSRDDQGETPLQQELYTIGYYIVTIDGPRVTVDFYSANHGQDYGSLHLDCCPSLSMFYLRERFGYSLNGDRFEIKQGDDYTGVIGSNAGTTAKILDGTNSNTKTDSTGRGLVKCVNTGWAQPAATDNAAGMIFSLWGMTDNLSLWRSADTPLPAKDKSRATDTYALSISFDHKKIDRSIFMKGGLAISARDGNGQWVNAVDLNTGDSAKTFVKGPYNSRYGLGTYGVDPGSKTAWAVINHEGDFVVKHIEFTKQHGRTSHKGNKSSFFDPFKQPFQS
ncbi:metallophosphoesterase family protein [Desulfobacter curvatus]|uniref:metallophosphoesterase family protein n=1 Tax=Desulfobacter curvatus TaxID=2290 RepID=UPI00037FEC48|nr:metallophosphoesterase [Desulfobacter curvatus]